MKKLESTRKIINGSVIRIYKKGFGYSKITVIDSTDYYLAAMADDELYRAIREGDSLDSYLWVEDVASYEFELSFIGKILTGPPILFFGHTDAIVRSGDRKCLTATVKIPFKFFTFDPGDTTRGITSEQIVYHEGTVVLLSDREATIQTKEKIGASRFLKGQAAIQGQVIELVGMVDELNESKGIYNVLFAGMHEKERKTILDFIFTTYRE